MPKAKLTKRTVDAQKPGEQDQVLWDTEISGFGLKVTPAGRRVYLLKYRMPGSRRVRKYTIGTHGSPWTPDQARTEAVRLLGKVAGGSDPGLTRDQVKTAPTIGMLCELYVSEGCATKKESTRAGDQSRIRRHILPLLGRRSVDDLTRADVERFMQDVANGQTAAVEKTRKRGKAVVTGGKGTARKAVSLLGAILEFAILRGLRADNPAHGIRRYPERRMERFLSPAELARLGEVLAEAEKTGTNPSAINAIRLLALTGCRKSEILRLRWEDVDADRALLLLPDSKTGAKAVTLGAPALQLLLGLDRMEGNPHVFPGGAPGDHFKGIQKVWTQLRPKAGLQDVRLHDLRHSFASVGAASGDSLLIIGALLGHRNAATTQRYAHLSDDPTRAAADNISSKIAAWMDVTANTGDVVPIAGGK